MQTVLQNGQMQRRPTDWDERRLRHHIQRSPSDHHCLVVAGCHWLTVDRSRHRVTGSERPTVQRSCHCVFDCQRPVLEYHSRCVTNEIATPIRTHQPATWEVFQAILCGL